MSDQGQRKIPPDCSVCGKPVPPTNDGRGWFYYNKSCSLKCRKIQAVQAHVKSGHAKPVGSRNQRDDGYVQVKVGLGHPYGNPRGWALEHRLVMSEYLERPLLPGEQIHHRNGDRSDNRIENLELWTLMQPSGQRLSERPHCPTCSC